MFVAIFKNGNKSLFECHTAHFEIPESNDPTKHEMETPRYLTMETMRGDKIHLHIDMSICSVYFMNDQGKTIDSQHQIGPVSNETARHNEYVESN